MRINILILLLILFSIQTYARTQPDEELFREAKILIFDEKWERAQQKLEELMEEYPESSYYSQSLFYRAKCLGEQKGKETQALNAYKDYLRLKERNQSLSEESEISIIDTAFELFTRGRKSYLREIEGRLDSSNKVIRYYAAFKLSYIEDKKVASRGIPVLKQILSDEADHELRDRAKIALLRVAPQALRDFEEKRYERRARILKIRVYEKGEKRAKISLNIPWALADLALGAIPEEEKKLIREKGYDLDKVIRELTEVRGSIVEIKGEHSVIKMWID
ncbi:MAG: hypothetical protein ACLFVG_03515 [Candidatus Aminicenantes bacterium]